jgi:hypothetical protein
LRPSSAAGPIGSAARKTLIRIARKHFLAGLRKPELPPFADRLDISLFCGPIDARRRRMPKVADHLKGNALGWGEESHGTGLLHKEATPRQEIAQDEAPAAPLGA